MPERKQAVVVGALGVIGRYIVEQLLRQEDWSVMGLSRRPAEAGPRYSHISADLLDGRDIAAKLAGLAEATHVFYGAFQPAAGAAAGYATNIAPNRDMLVNAVTAIDVVSSALRRVVLVTGTKYYGSHLGPFRTLSGHRIHAFRQRGAVGGERAALRARSLQHHQRRLFPLAESVTEVRRRLRYAGRRAADDQSHGTHGGQDTAVAGHDREIQGEALCLRRARGLAVCRLRLRLRLGRDVGRHQVTSLRLS
jgi:nucleoside-diphosphate-sugar epimerase